MSLQDLASKNHKQKQKKVSVTQIKDKKTMQHKLSKQKFLDS